MKELKQRQKYILRHLIRGFIDTASPVASQHLAKHSRLDCSPATVRNEMANLEEMGYIMQPHTSAGRIPTDKGYRYYIDHLMKPVRIDTEKEQHIRNRISPLGGDVKHILEEASKILGMISKELGVVLTPWISFGIFDRMELIQLSKEKILVVIHVQSRLVRTVVMKISSDLKPEELEKTAQMINERLSGLSIEEIKDSIGLRMQNASCVHPILMRQVVESANDLFNFSEPMEVHTCGTHYILSHPEFADIQNLGPIFALIDDRAELMHVFHRKTRETAVTIGEENGDNRLQSCAVISACYNRGRDVGTLGVIGPKRLKYRQVLPLVDFMAKTMSHYLS